MSLPTWKTRVARHVILDGRLCLAHESQRWLAVADLHYGYEKTRRLDGHLFPMWGMANIEDRLGELIEDYRPETLILLGDLVDGRGGALEFVAMLARQARPWCRLVCIRGNHDRAAVLKQLPLVDTFETEGYLFHHGHATPAIPAGRQAVTGHLHPSVCLRDGAGLRLRLPAFIQDPRQRRWTLPAFSPWAGGGALPEAEERNGHVVWACSRQRVFRVWP